MKNINKLLMLFFIFVFCIIFIEVGYLLFFNNAKPEKNTGAVSNPSSYSISKHLDFIDEVFDKTQKTENGKMFIVFEGTGFLKDFKLPNGNYYSFKVYNSNDEKIFGELVKVNDEAVAFYNKEGGIIPLTDVKNDSKINFIFKYNVITKMIEKIEIFSLQ